MQSFQDGIIPSTATPVAVADMRFWRCGNALSNLSLVTVAVALQ